MCDAVTYLITDEVFIWSVCKELKVSYLIKHKMKCRRDLWKFSITVNRKMVERKVSTSISFTEKPVSADLNSIYSRVKLFFCFVVKMNC